MVLVPQSKIEGQARVDLPVILNEGSVMAGVCMGVRLNHCRDVAQVRCA
jgi:hypothetical protein